MAIENFQRFRHYIVFSAYYRTHLGWVRKKLLKIEALRRLENAIVNLVLANSIAILLILKAKFTESLLDILSYSESTIKPTMVGWEKIFQNGGSQMARKCYFDIGFCQ